MKEGMKKIFAIIVCLSCCAEAAAQTYTLEQLLDSARQNNIAIRTAQHSIQAASQQRKEAFTKYFPHVSATGLWFNSTQDMAKITLNPAEMLNPQLTQLLPPSVLTTLFPPTSISMVKNGVLGAVTAVQPVFAGGQIINKNRLARVSEDVSKIRLSLSQNEVENTTEQYFWQLATLQEKLRTIQAAEKLLGDIHKDVDVALRAGVAMPNDLLQVQLRLNELSSQKLQVMNGISLVRMLLGQYAGLTPAAPSQDGGYQYAFEIAVPDLEEQQKLLPAPVAGQEDVSSLPEYQLLVKAVESARLQRKLAVGQNLPTVGVGVGYSYHNLFDKGRSFGTVFATVNVPISDWWGGSHAIKRRKIELQKAEEQLADNTELLRIRTLNAWNNVQESYQQLLLAQRSIEQAQENLRLNRNYYNAGTSKMSDLLQAQLLYQQAQDKRTDAYSDYQNKVLEYKQVSK